MAVIFGLPQDKHGRTLKHQLSLAMTYFQTQHLTNHVKQKLSEILAIWIVPGRNFQNDWLKTFAMKTILF